MIEISFLITEYKIFLNLVFHVQLNTHNAVLLQID
jgi:hypothetical protein